MILVRVGRQEDVHIGTTLLVGLEAAAEVCGDIARAVFWVVGRRPDVAVNQDVGAGAIAEGDQRHIAVPDRMKNYLCCHVTISSAEPAGGWPVDSISCTYRVNKMSL
jgi:hypothetical protein